MEYYAGIDVSLEQSSVCIVDVKGKIVREAKVASEPGPFVGHECHQPEEVLPVPALSQSI
jgi:hypothetical protein